jgi:lysophospholipid acyltransferase (LPLAT)-like uncharacterized protein
MPERSKLARRIRFFVIEKILLPIAIVPLRLIVRSWRLDPPDLTIVHFIGARPRPVLLTFHGMFLQLLAYRYLAVLVGRRLVVMLTPSLDGRLLAAALKHFGIDHVMATPGNRGVAGTLEFNRRLDNGCIGVIAVDGPHGPACVVQSRALELSRASKVETFIAITSAHRGIHFGSWDRAFLPLPFARTIFRLEEFVPAAGNFEALQTAMIRKAREIKSPVLPAAVEGD